MTEVLYHAEIGFPKFFRAPLGTVRVAYGSHARRESFCDRYGVIDLPDSINLSLFKVVELGVQDGRISKMLFRGPLDRERDMCIVLVPKIGEPWFAKTVWVNLRTDKHATLNKSRYAMA